MIAIREIAFVTHSFPLSIRLAISTSPSWVNWGSVAISRRYIRTESLVLSTALGVTSRSMSPEPSPRQSGTVCARHFCAESTTSIPALPKRDRDTDQNHEISKQIEIKHTLVTYRYRRSL